MSASNVAGCLLLGLLVCSCPSAHAQTETAAPPPEQRRARKILQALEAGRTGEALIEARSAAKQYPMDAVVRRRLAQAQLCSAIELDRRLGAAMEDVAFSQQLEVGLALLRNPITEPRNPANVDKFREFARVADSPSIAQFRARVKDRSEETRVLREQRVKELLAATAEAGEARRLGDHSPELALSELWMNAVALLWRDELGELRQAEARAGNAEKPGATSFSAEVALSLQELASVKAEAVLKEAQALAQRHPNDASTLAGAADVISVVGEIGRYPDPLRHYSMELLNRRFAAHSGKNGGGLAEQAQEAARRLYEQAREAPEMEVTASPWTVALQLYNRALQLDPRVRLPYLRARLYLWTLAFDPQEARSLLGDLERVQPGNPVVALERARAAFHIDKDPAAGMKFCREALRLRSPSFARSFLVAAPSALRPSLKYARRLDSVFERGWPGYGWLFTTLLDAQLAQKEPSAALDLLLLRLKVADHLTSAPDYPDQALGIHQKELALSQLATLGERLPEAQRAFVHAQLQAHQQLTADFPRKRTMMFVGKDGIYEGEFPKRGMNVIKGYHLIIGREAVIFGHGFIRH